MSCVKRKSKRFKNDANKENLSPISIHSGDSPSTSKQVLNPLKLNFTNNGLNENDEKLNGPIELPKKMVHSKETFFDAYTTSIIIDESSIKTPPSGEVTQKIICQSDRNGNSQGVTLYQEKSFDRENVTETDEIYNLSKSGLNQKNFPHQNLNTIFTPRGSLRSEKKYFEERAKISPRLIGLQKRYRSFNFDQSEDDPIYLSTFSGAYEPLPTQLTKIERLDWLAHNYIASPYFYRSKSSNTHKKHNYENLIFESMHNDYVSSIIGDSNYHQIYRHSLNLDTNFNNESRKMRYERRRNSKLDPWKAARSPNADIEPFVKTRYESPINASTSRVCSMKCLLQASKSFYPSYFINDKSIAAQRNALFNSGSRHIPQLNTNYKSKGLINRKKSKNFAVNRPVSTCATSPKPGYGLSDILIQNSLSPKMEPFYVSINRHNNNYIDSLESICDSIEDLKKNKSKIRDLEVYPYDLIRVSENKSLPENVDRKNLEMHLSEQEFEEVFGMSIECFYQLPYWKRTELKKIVDLF